jgi:hypothetical protein
MGIHLKRSNVKNWKIKEHIRENGDAYYTVWYKSIFGWWRSVQESSEFPDGYSHRKRFISKELAKKVISEVVSNNLAESRRRVVKVKEIKF